MARSLQRSRHLHAALAAAGLLAGLAAISGCGDAVAPLGEGVLRASWQISPRGCEAAGVETVEVSVEGEASRSETFPCVDGEGEIEELPPGNYALTLSGLDDRGQAIFGAEEASVTVRADVISEAPFLRLTALPATARVSWRFDDGRLCAPNGVERVEVAIFDAQDYEVDRVDFVCNEGEGTIGDLTAGEYLVEAVAYDAEEQATHRGTASLEVDRGDEAIVDLVLEPTS